jgi:hypothetical protein
MVHAALDDWMFDAEHLGNFCFHGHSPFLYYSELG